MPAPHPRPPTPALPHKGGGRRSSRISRPRGPFALASDGEVAVAPSNDVVLRRFLRTVGLEALLDDARFDSNDKRFARRDELNAMINQAMSRDSQAAWIERLNAAGVPSGKVQNLAEVFSDPQVHDQEMVIEVEHPGHGSVRMLGFPVKLSGTPCEAQLPAPRLGEHNEEILGPLRRPESARAGREVLDLNSLRVHAPVERLLLPFMGPGPQEGPQQRA